MFFGSGFWRPPGTIFKGFGGGFRGVFSCFFEHVGQGSVLRKTSFCIVIYGVSGTSPFSKKLKNEQNTYNFMNVFREGRRQLFSAMLETMWAPF